MVSQADVDKQLKNLNLKMGQWGHSELSELVNVLTPNEKISQVVNGYYENGFALLVSTDHRMLLIDKKPFNFLNVEDFRFDMINQLDYNHRLFKSSINVSAGPKNLRFVSYNQKGLRELLNCVQCRMIEIKEEKKDAVVKQHSKLDQLDQTLKQYIQAQLRQSQQPRLESGLDANADEEPSFNQPAPTGGLSSQVALDDYLRQLDSTDAGDRYIKTGSLLPKVDVHPARIAFAKLPSLINSRRHFSGH